MASRPIAYLDSGLGGFPYFDASRRALPHLAHVYYADTASFPYGERAPAELSAIVTSAVDRLIADFDPMMVVVACNTASVVALDALRATFALPFVGVVPAIKPAAERYGTGPIGLIATTRTVEDPYVSALIRRYAPESRVVMVAAGGLVDRIERNGADISASELNDVLRGPIATLATERVRCVVLGCTHFIHVRNHVQSMLGDGVALVDSVEGVTRQIVRVAGADNSQPSPSPSPPQSVLVLSSRAEIPAAYERIARSRGLLVHRAEEGAP
ncbi:MAG: glutamate racemase [Spirochaetaceae bacterium]|nr:MAG: glutamate racemase [Spirochaetaceae bacterium]